MIDILNLAVPYFGLIFIGFACGKAISALCVAAGTVIRHHVENAVHEAEQPAVPDCDDICSRR